MSEYVFLDPREVDIVCSESGQVLAYRVPSSSRSDVGDPIVGFPTGRINAVEAAKVLHREYEAAALTHGWRTTTHGDWERLPRENRQTMIDATCALLVWVARQL